MRILLGHNFYQQLGGEDGIYQAELNLLKSQGHQVYSYERHNNELQGMSFLNKSVFFLEMGFSQKTYRDVKNIIRDFQPEVAHFHNIFYMITPAAYAACRDSNVPVVQSLHNFRLLTPGGLLYPELLKLDGNLNAMLWEGVKHRSFRNSYLLSAWLAWQVKRHWNSRRWQEGVTRYVITSRFSRDRLVKAGLPKDKIVLKPNFIYPDLGKRKQVKEYALYCGRLSEEKGIEKLVSAWKHIDYPLKIVGGGPLENTLRSYIKERRLDKVELMGFISKDKVYELMSNAKFMVIPSCCFENFPMVLAEAFSLGIPVAASNMGIFSEIISPQKTGVLFDPNNEADIINQVSWLLKNAARLSEMGNNARTVYEEQFTAEKNYQFLMDIYDQARNN